MYASDNSDNSDYSDHCVSVCTVVKPFDGIQNGATALPCTLRGKNETRHGSDGSSGWQGGGNAGGGSIGVERGAEQVDFRRAALQSTALPPEP